MSTYKHEWIDKMFPEVSSCSISISKTITQKEWKKIYKEILSLAKKLDLCYLRKFNFDGVEGNCISRAAEVTEEVGIFYPTKETRLKLEGIYSQRTIINQSYIGTKLMDEWSEQDKGSAFLGYAYSDHTLSTIILGDEIENETYIISILAIAFYMEARLPEKIFVYGNFPYEYAVNAVKKVNQVIKTPIQLPLICRAKDLMEKTQQTNFSEKEKCKFFRDTYIGKYDEEYWNLLHENFPDEIIPDSINNIATQNETTAQKADKDNIQYDIELSVQLFNFKKGNTINPDILKDIITVLNNVEPAKKQNGFTILSKYTPLEQVKRLAWHANSLLLLDTDWKHIINCFKTRKNALERYYPLFMVSCDTYGTLSNIVRALIVNDTLYKHCAKIQKQNNNK